jgi:hypothetical protein
MSAISFLRFHFRSVCLSFSETAAIRIPVPNYKLAYYKTLVASEVFFFLGMESDFIAT